MMEIGPVLAALRKKMGMTQTEVGRCLARMGCPVTCKAVSKWETGTSMPDAVQFLLLCDIYGVEDISATFTGKGSTVLNELGQQRLIEYTELLLGNDNYSVRPKKPRSQRLIPLYDIAVSAGTGLFLDSDSYELIEAGEGVPAAAGFAVRISGDSMEPRFLDGELVYVRQQQTLEPGEFGIFLLNGDAYLKRLENGPVLVSLNAKYAPISIAQTDEFRVIGKVLA